MKNGGLTALVAEGGAMKGCYVAGVLKALFELNIKHFDIVVGSSASAATTAYFVTDQLYEGIKIWENELNKEFLNWFGLLKGRLLNLDYLVDYLMKEKIPLDIEKLKNSNTLFYIPVTKYKTASPSFFSNKQLDEDELFKAIKASMALPVAYDKPVKIRNAFYVDGGLTVPIPVEPIYKAHNEVKNVIVISTKPKDYRHRNPFLLSLLFWYKSRKLPKALKEVMSERKKYHEEAWKKVRELQKDRNVIVIRPKEELPIGKYDNNKERIESTIKQGVEDVLNLSDEEKEKLEVFKTHSS